MDTISQFSKHPEFINANETDKAVAIAFKDKATAVVSEAENYIGQGFYTIVQNQKVLKEEFATNSILHRGFYCPSPVTDFLVGNSHRGRIIKRPTSKSHIAYRYLHGENGIFMVESFKCGGIRSVSASEFLLRSKDSITGIATTDKGKLRSVSKEIYDGEKIVEYFWVLCHQVYGTPYLAEYEKYSYDEDGINECERFNISFGNDTSVHGNKYQFGRVDGFLESYFNTKYPAIVYTPGIKRSAMPPYFVK